MKDKIKKNIYIVICFLSYFLLDWILRRTYLSYGDLSLYDRIPLFFVLGWCILLCGIIYCLHVKIKRFFMGISIVVYGILVLVHGAYINVFDKFFSFSDLALAKEGADFVDASYIDIRKRIIIVVILSVILMGIAIYIVPKKENRKICIIAGMIMLFLGVGSVQYAKYCLPEKQEADVWNVSQNIGNVYEDFVDSKRCLLMSGIYQYSFRDLTEQINPFEKMQYEEVVRELDDYFEKNDIKKIDNAKTGIFKGKNLILVQLENIDTWMLTEQNMPNLYQLKTEGIDFVNHFSVGFATGRTFNTEFIVNTGYVPQPNGATPSYIYSKNKYPYSLAHLMKKEGYTANSYHSNNGNIYNRAQAHSVFGYEKYHNWTDMEMDDYTMDSQLLNNFDVLVPSDKFFDFIITYSGHGPFTTDNAACAAHIDEVRSENNDPDEIYLCGLAQAKETDLFVKKLIQHLEESNLINDTILVFYTDHYAYSTVSAEKELELKGTSDSNLIQNTPFFIWGSEVTPEVVEKVTDTTDILPTLANMFDLDCKYQYYVGKDAFEENRGYALFSDFSWYDGETYYNNKYAGEITDEIEVINKEVQEKINMSWKVLESNYFESSNKE